VKGNGLLLDGHNDSTLQCKVLTMNLLQHNKKQMKIKVLDKKVGLFPKIKITLHSYKTVMGTDNFRDVTTCILVEFFLRWWLLYLLVIHGIYIHRDDEENYCLIKEELGTSEMSTFFYQSTRRCVQKDTHLYSHNCENLKPIFIHLITHHNKNNRNKICKFPYNVAFSVLWLQYLSFYQHHSKYQVTGT